MYLKIALFISIILLLFATNLFSQTLKFTFQRPKMGSPFVITVYADDSIAILPFIEKAYQRVDTLNQIFSDYLDNSEINTVCRKPYVWQPISDDLYHLLTISSSANKASHGAFDVTVGPIVKVWRKARKLKQMPDDAILQTALSKIGFKKFQIGSQEPKIMFYTEGVQLDFGGIVKGFAAQEVVNILTKNGLP